MCESNSEKIVVVSDVHLGKHRKTDQRADRMQFKEFLRELIDGSEIDHLKNVDNQIHLVLNGDIDDLWRRDMRTLTRENYDIYNMFNELKEEDSITVHYLLGNHDWYARKDRDDKTFAGKKRFKRIRGLFSKLSPFSPSNGTQYDIDEEEKNERRKWVEETNKPFFDTEYKEFREITLGKTKYRFEHGHEFDRYQIKGIFDALSVISDDALGATLTEMWAIFIRTEGVRDKAKVLWTLIRFNWLTSKLGLVTPRGFVDRLDKIGRQYGVVIPNSDDRFEQDAKLDWLCIGHTHTAGIWPPTANAVENPTTVTKSSKYTDKNDRNTKVANSGAWMGLEDSSPNTYLVLEEESVSLWKWNKGQPFKPKLDKEGEAKI